MTQNTAAYTNPDLLDDSPAWTSFIWLSFGIAMTLMIVGIYYLPVDWWIRGYLYMGTLFLTASMLTLSKALRDRHEYTRLVNRVASARTEQVLSKYES
ncbi:YiaA/YiaB family inner membrane protein [Deinococcus arenicola]|uniref:YiaA/YiaB family inner membrane protein n=1 Tax=Deinococcus arenicola TaxID=2994950 RepID=A0ABU4DS07_9DEIO|nr:YiaA/YiaB family inner membrane protein [Deinococcus sp. ZS9-10]MDV6375218.1 YiaA/YiaB family inner membrane protein [Deinococcus sp. ZS9-10]